MVNAKLQLERQDKRRLAQLREELGCFRSREKLEKQARSGHKGVSALIWRRKKRKEEDRRRGGGGAG